MRSYMTLSYSDYHFDAGKGSCCDGGGYQKRKSGIPPLCATEMLLQRLARRLYEAISTIP